MAGIRLSEILTTVGDPLVEQLTEGDPRITDVAIVEPGDEVTDGELALLVGVRGQAAVQAVKATSAAAIAVKLDGPGDRASLSELVAAARAAGTVLLAVASQARWQQIESLARTVLEAAREPYYPDLFSLAETVATLTGGPVTIEDAAHRVLAYSQSDDGVDELRRLSILGRNCPESFLQHLRQWGVYRRIWSAEEVAEVAAHPELGIRRRLAVGIHAGSRPLGSIWVQESGEPLASRSAEVLRGAARVAALHLVRADGGGRTGEELAVGLLTGEFDTAALAAHLGVSSETATGVVGIDLYLDPAEPDRPSSRLRQERIVGMISVHATAYHRNALVIPACGKIYVLLPGHVGTPEWLSDLVALLRGHVGTPVQAAVAGSAGRLDEIPAVKKRAARILHVMAGDRDRLVAAEPELRAALLLDGMLTTLAPHGQLRDPAVARLAAEHPELARSLRLYLDLFGDVNQAAALLHVHPNTLRHRVRRAATLAGLDLDDPDQRLATMIQLRLPS